MKKISSFRTTVWKYWKENGRHDLPWRKTRDPYRIMVSEVMLQQTQVPRVIEKYKEFLNAFPNIEALARSSLADVLKVWSGMGYNRRGKYLRDAAIAIVERHQGKVPRDSLLLRALPGIGPYTASAVLIFAFNTPDTMIETNIRTVFIHHFFGVRKSPNWENRGTIHDSKIIPILQKAAEGQDPRTWHWAVMDYGSHLKKIHKNPSRASAHYAKQSKFEGSLRQVRGAILRELHKGPLWEKVLYGSLSLLSKKLPQVKPAEQRETPIGSLIRANRRIVKISRVTLDASKFDEALLGLARDGMILKQKGKWRIA